MEMTPISRAKRLMHLVILTEWNEFFRALDLNAYGQKRMANAGGGTSRNNSISPKARASAPGLRSMFPRREGFGV